MTDHVRMQVDDVVDIVTGLESAGVTVWLDGGWCVDALVGRQTRDHSDLDVAVARSDEAGLRTWFRDRGYSEVPRAGELPWNFVLGDGSGRLVDVHVFEFDEQGGVRYGIEYPRAALTGTAALEGVSVRCISPEWMFRFKTAYPPAAKDLADVRALHDVYGFEIPPSHTAGA
jgi:lincosamide nucleotidyltransferase A/C/D/E